MNHPTPLDLLGTPREALPALLADHGIPAHLAMRVFHDLHHGVPWSDDAQIGPRFGAQLQALHHDTRPTVAQRHDADDGTTRLLLSLHDDARIEAVLVAMPGGRTTLCLSSQVGCAMGCTFCATGTLGLTRHLTAAEIVGQVSIARQIARADGRDVDRIVFMGMGEPLHNLQGTLDALAVLTDGAGPGIGGRRITVSTVGLPTRLAAFADAVGPKVGLALSLHAGTDATRARIVPMGRSVSLSALRAVLTDTPALARRTWMAEYVVLPGMNDTEAEADGVAAFVQGLTVAVNLLRFNPFEGAAFRSPTPEEVTRFADALRARGVYVTARRSRGQDVDGACGQLALRDARV